jgi:hypothetical protein
MPRISQNVKPRAEQEDFLAWAATLTAKKTNQWCHSDHQYDNKTRDVISSRSRNQISVSEPKRSNTFTYNFGRNMTFTTTHTTSN